MFCRVTYLSPAIRAAADTWESAFTDFVISGQSDTQGTTMVSEISSHDTQTLRQQVETLGSISNYHWWAPPVYYGGVQQATKVSYKQKLFSRVDLVESMDGSGRPLKYPASPRNKMMFHILFPGHPDRLMECIIFCVKYDRDEEQTVLLPPTSQKRPTFSGGMGESSKTQPSAKKRRYATRVIKGNPQDLLQDVNPDCGGPEDAVQSCAPARTFFTSFSEQLSTAGLIQWRKHSPEEDVVVMSDYSPTLGKLIPLDFVHVTATLGAPGTVFVKCTCRIYQYMQGAALKKIRLQAHEHAVLDEKFTCMHCRFYREILLPLQDKIHSPDSTVHGLADRVKQSLDVSNSPVVLLGDAVTVGSTKLSVLGIPDFSLVHIHFTPSGCFAKCQSGLCQTMHHCRKKVPKGISFEDLRAKDSLCSHLNTLFQNKEFLFELFPSYFHQDDEEAMDDTDSPAPPVPEEINIDDLECRDFDSGSISFNVNEGVWECNSFSQYKPTEERLDPDLVKATAHRLSFIKGDLVDGCYRGPELSSKPIDSSGVVKTCPCGATYNLDLGRFTVRRVKVYTRQVWNTVEHVRNEISHFVRLLYL